MNKKQKHPILLLPLLLVGGLTLADCTDNNYDLSDIDGTVAFGSDKGITLPGNNSTTEIKLSDLIDIDGSDCITTLDNDDYALFKVGDDVDPVHPSIDRIRITKRSADDIPQKVGPDSEPEGWDAVPIGTTISGTAGSIERNISFFDYRGDKPQEVVDLQEVDIDGTVSLSLSFNNNLQAFLPRFTSVDVLFPQYMTLKNVSRGTVVGNKIVFGSIPTNEVLTVTAEVASLTFGKGDADNVIKVDGDKVIINGNVKLVATYPDLVKGVGDITDMQINGTTHITDIDIVSATGRFNPSIDLDDLGDVKITNVPDFLDDPEVNISIHDPQITLNVNSNMDIDGIVDGTLTAYFKDGSQRTVAVNDISVPRRSNSKILICRQPKAMPYEDYTQVKVVSNLSDLVKTIPERMTFKANAQADQTTTGTFLLGYDGYEVSTAYQLEARLALDAGSVVVYNDTIDGWHEDLKDIDMSLDSRVMLTFDVDNKVPADVALEIVPIGVDGTDLNTPQKTWIEVKNPATVKPGTTKGVTAEIVQKEPKAMKQLDGIRIHAVITSADAIPLNKSTQTIKLENITATLVGKVVMEDNKD